MFVLTREERKVYESGHWHDSDPKGSPAISTAFSTVLSPSGVADPGPTVAPKRKRRRTA